MNQTLTLTRIESKLFLRDWTGVFFVFALPVGLLTIFSLVSGGNNGSDGVPTSSCPRWRSASGSACSAWRHCR